MPRRAKPQTQKKNWRWYASMGLNGLVALSMVLGTVFLFTGAADCTTALHHSTHGRPQCSSDAATCFDRNSDRRAGNSDAQGERAKARTYPFRSPCHRDSTYANARAETFLFRLFLIVNYACLTLIVFGLISSAFGMVSVSRPFLKDGSTNLFCLDLYGPRFCLFVFWNL